MEKEQVDWGPTNAVQKLAAATSSCQQIFEHWKHRQALEIMMQLFFTLLLAHLFADFPLQSNIIARLKKYHLVGVLIHVSIYTAVTALRLERRLQYWPLIVGVGIVHILIDATKMRFSRDTDGTLSFLADQLLHLASMLGAAYLAQRDWTPAPQGILPTGWLFGALLAALTPAAIVCCWVYTSRCCAGSINVYTSG